MRPLRYILILLLSIPLMGKDVERIEVRPCGTEHFDAMPGEVITTLFKVSNFTSRRQELISRIDVPKGWKVITNDFRFYLDPAQTSTRLISFFVPRNAGAGEYEVIYSAGSRKFLTYSDSYKVKVVVKQYHKLRTEVLSSPEFVIAGDSYKVSFLLIDESNTSEEITINIDSERDYPYSVNIEKLNTPKYRSSRVDITVQTDSECNKLFNHKVRLTASLKRHKEITSESTSYVKIIPRTTGEKDRYHRIPVSFSFGQFLQKNGSAKYGFQADVYGEGSLDEKGERHIQFRLRGPDIYERSILARRDEYFLNYQSRNLNLSVGDRIYTLTTLTEMARYGRGVESKINLKNFSFGTYYLRSRWLRPIRDEIASYFKYNFSGKNMISLNYLNKDYEDSKKNMVSIAGKFEPIKGSEVELEYSTGLEGDQKQSSYLFGLQGRYSKSDYFVRWIYASPDFPGYYHDTNYFSAGLNLLLNRRLSFNVNVRHERQNFELDTLKFSAPLIRFYRAGIQYRIRNNTNIRVGIQEHARKDRFPESKYDYMEKSLRLGFSQRVGKFFFMARAEIGVTENYLTDKQFSTERYIFSSYFKPTPKYNFNGYIYYNNYSWFTGDKKHLLTAGLNISMWLTERTSFYLNYQNNQSPEEYYFDRNIFGFSLRHTLPNDHQIYMLGRKTILRHSLDKAELAIMVGYRVSVGVPIAKKKNTGVVRGVVRDAITAEPIEDLIIRINGSTAVTDRFGKFIFPSLFPRTYYLTLDKANVGLNRVCVEKTPMEIVVRGGEEKSIELTITDGCEVSGRVAVYSEIGDNKGQDGNIGGNLRGPAVLNTYVVSGSGGKKFGMGYGLPNILVEMKRDDELLRRLTDSQGYFKFEDLRPGSWELKFYDNNLPQYHKFEKSLYQIRLKPGEKKELLVKVVPEKRRIKMQQEGGLLIEKKKSKSGNKKSDSKDAKVEKDYRLSLKMFEQRRYQKALTILKGLLKRYPNHWLASNFQYWIGECYYALKEYSLALDAFKKVLKYDSSFKFDDALLMCGIINKMLGNEEFARENFETLIAKYPKSEYVSKAMQYLDSFDPR